MTQDEDFKKWWFNEGSHPPYTHHDCEEHTMRMCEIAWANGAYKEREACAQACENLPIPNQFSESEGSVWDVAALDCAEAIRARGQGTPERGQA
jgi:hypothetical protein